MKRETLGVKISYTSTDSPIGTIYIAATPAGICAVSISVNEETFLSEIKKLGEPEKNDRRLNDVKKDLQGYLSGESIDFTGHALDSPIGTEFQRKVWKKLLEIPFGETRSYKWLAEKVGSPNGFRAVGGANGKNPIPIIIPCHRVINSDGTLGGYSGGVWIKEWLLGLEGAV